MTGIAATSNAVFVTGALFAGGLPVTGAGVQQSSAPNSTGDGFVESFSTGTGTLRYATYLTGANGNTAPAAIAVDSSGNAYIAGTTSATGYPTNAALVPTFRITSSNNVSGFITKLSAAGDAFLFSTFVPGNGLTSIALDPGGVGSLLVSGDIATGLFPLTEVQTPIAPQLSYQTAMRLPLDGTSVLSSTLLAPGTDSVIAPGPDGAAWIFGSAPLTGSAPLLPLQPLENLGNAFALRVAANGTIDRAARFGGLPIQNSGFASMPVSEGGIAVSANGTVALAGTATPTLSSALLPTEQYDFPFTSAPSAALPATVRDALPLSTCNGSACPGSAGLLAMLTPDASTPALALSTDALPNLTLRNFSPFPATSLQITTDGYTVSSGCGSTLHPGAACALLLNGSGPGSITVHAAHASAFTTALPAATLPPQPLVVLPHELDFGIQTATSATATRTLTVQNLGTTPQTFVSQNAATPGKNVTPPTGSPLTETNSTCTPANDGVSKTLAAGGSCTITLALTASNDATQDGSLNALWTVGGNDIHITGYMQAASVTLSAATIDFGRQYTGGLRIPRYLYLSNSSDSLQSHIATVSNNAAFNLTDECPATLQPHSVCRIVLGYNAASSPSSDAMTLAIDGLQVQVLGETLPQSALSGAAANPNLALSAENITFATPVTVTAASGETESITLTNMGAAALQLSLTVTGDFNFTTDCPGTLNGGGHCAAVLTFTPAAPGLRQGLFTAAVGAASPAYVELSGTGTAILPSGNAVAFGDIPLNTPSLQWIKVSQSFVNFTATSNDTSYKVLLVEDTGFGHGQPAPSAFATTTTGSCLNCYLGVQFLPTAAGQHTASLELSSPGSGRAQTVPLTGNGVPLAGLILTPLAQDFGPVPVHTATASTIFQLTNATASSMTTSAAATYGDFSITTEATGGAPCTASTIPSGASCFVPVRFNPTATGTRTGTLTVTTSAGFATASLTGIGAEDPGIAFAPSSLRFTNATGTSQTQQTVTVTNTGSTPATVGTASITGPHFTVTGNCGTLAPSASCVETVTYTAGEAIVSSTLTLPVTTSPSGSPVTAAYTLLLQGGYTAEDAGLQIVPGEDTAMNFGAAPTGAAATTRILHVNNTTAHPLTLTVNAPREFAITGNNCAGLAAGSGCDLTVSYTPLTTGDTTGTIFVQGTPADGSTTRKGLAYLEGYGNGNATLDLTGDISPTGLVSFGQVASGLTATATLILTNPITTPTGSSITVRRVLSEFPYRSATTCGAPLAPGQGCTVSITYAPLYQATGGTTTAPQIDTGTVTIESDAANSPLFVDLSGQASASTASVPNNVAPIAAYTTSQGSLYFPLTGVGNSSAPQPLQITNSGTETIHVLGIATQTGFSATSNCNTLPVGASCDVSVTFVPQTAGSTLGSLQIQTDAGAALDFVSLLGTAAPASINLAPQSLDFGRVPLGRSSAQRATLTNTGATPITLNAVTTAGAGYTASSSSPSGDACPAPGGALAAGTSCTIAAVFTPTSAATLRGTLTVATSGTPLLLSIRLTGVGAQPQLFVTPSSLDFGAVAIGNSSTLSLTVANISTTPVDTLVFTSTPSSFSITSTCGIASLQPGSSCAVSVTYKPAGNGLDGGAMTITSSDPASPILVPLTGHAILGGGFTLTANGSNAATATVQAGIAATYNLLLTPTDGYTGNVALTCTADTLIDDGYCSLLPSNITLTGNTAQNATVNITTVTAVDNAALHSPRTRSAKSLLACLAPIALLTLLRRRRAAAFLVIAAAIMTFSGGCGSGGDRRIRYVAPGTYRFHVTAAPTNTIPGTASVNLTLVVQPRS